MSALATVVSPSQMTFHSADPLAMLIDRVAGADRQALAELYRRMSRKIFAFALRHLNDRDLAEGVVVDTMFEVWKNAARFGRGSSVSTWILGIARHKALDEVRRRARYVPFDETTDVDVEDEGCSAFDIVAARQTRERLNECLARLPGEQRECIHLTFFEELSQAEIAELQGVPESTVKTRLFHARRKLKIMLSRRADCVSDLA
ncbi:MAG: sigma-70 family RNA polymerase sigma factor [Burkholderiales bacterium]|nr:sigma-70 family RNA polymerase sigma factor [Burkholderiales bacterium]